MYYSKLLFILFIFSSSLFSQIINLPNTQSLKGLDSNCQQVNTVFFDLGDTLVETNGNGMFQLRMGASEMIDTLTMQGISIGIITNVPSNWTLSDLEDILVDPSFLDDFEVVVLSSLAPAAKPDPAIYNYAYSLLSNPPFIQHVAFVTENIDHIANTEVNPSLGARSVGMVGIHLSDLTPSPLTDYTVAPDDFQAIIDIVEDLIFCSSFE